MSPPDRGSAVAKHWWWPLGQFCLDAGALPVSDAVWWMHSFNDHLGIGRHFSLQCVIAAGPHREGNGRMLCLNCSSSELHLSTPTFWFPSKYLVYFHFYQKILNCPSLAKPNLFQPRGTEQLLVNWNKNDIITQQNTARKNCLKPYYPWFYSSLSH